MVKFDLILLIILVLLILTTIYAYVVDEISLRLFALLLTSMTISAVILGRRLATGA
ncbi:hypothetical protein ADIS_1900 [Lunatimonas lonarensis]|uniref:Uncharacterized protein n=1 Tax=Lunatimonas lonarensis TaxID=1232681 RepID=R7ZU52_9BACT|nr:hypothetical protein [Lunatimonas lonarensis]EON77681.1 hypothetical protein ADIS_1900 [Lunatimonas lonarensis]